MSSPENSTLDRLVRKDGCVTYNPFFSHISQANTADVSYGVNWNLQRYNGVELQRCPGWYAFGHFPQLQIQQPDPTTEDINNPFRSWESNDTRQGNGVVVRVRGTNQAGDGAIHPAGLCQRIRRGRMLVGKKIRVTGAYNIIKADTGGSPIPVGMSVWLKSRPLDTTAPVSVATPYVGDDDGVVDSALGRLYRAFGNFNTDSVVVGDLLVVGDLTLGALDCPVYQIKSVAPAGNYVEINGTFPNDVLSGATWHIGRQSDGSASYIGKQAIRLGDASIGHIIRVTDNTYADYDAGDEWLNRAFDSTVLPYVDSGETPAGPALYFGKYDQDIDTSSTQGLNGYPRGARIWYLNNQFNNNPASGNQELVTHTSASGVQYFEVDVEVDPALLVTKEDVWVCAFPCAPSDTASIDTDIAVQFLALRVEIIPSATDPIEDNLKRVFAAGGLGGHADFGSVDYDLRHCMQYPVYVPQLYPLKTMPMLPRLSGDIGGASTGEINYHYGPIPYSVPTSQAMTVIHSNVIENIYAPQSDLPVGSSVLGAALWVHYSDGLTNPVDVSLHQYHHVYPGNPSNFAQMTSYAGTSISGSVASPTRYLFDVYRNKMGHFWPQFSGTADPDSYAAQGTAQQLMVLTSTGVAGSADLWVSNGFLLVAVDPRLNQNAYWSRV